MNRYIFDGKKVYEQRKRCRYTRVYVCKELDIPETFLFRIEKEKEQTEYLDLMNNLAKMYDCYLDDFLKDGYKLR